VDLDTELFQPFGGDAIAVVQEVIRSIAFDEIKALLGLVELAAGMAGEFQIQIMAKGGDTISVHNDPLGPLGADELVRIGGARADGEPSSAKGRLGRMDQGMETDEQVFSA
jgi:hypothetical protein